MKTVLGILLTIAVVLFSFLSFTIVDYVFFDGTKLKDLQYEKACDFEVPKEWKIVSNGKYFAVEYSSEYGGKQYLSDGRFDIGLYSSSICYPTVLSSECRAKGYLKAYLNQNRDRAKDFK